MSGCVAAECLLRFADLAGRGLRIWQAGVHADSTMNTVLCLSDAHEARVISGCLWLRVPSAAWQAGVHAAGGQARSLTRSCLMLPPQITYAGLVTLAQR